MSKVESIGNAVRFKQCQSVIARANDFDTARRIAAALNACFGVPIEVLEANAAGGLPWSVAEQIELRVQRERAITALTVASASIRQSRTELAMAHTCPHDNTMDADGQAGVAEYDAVLKLIDQAIGDS